MIEKFFNTAAPIKPEPHYNVDPLKRIEFDRIESLIRQPKVTSSSSTVTRVCRGTRSCNIARNSTVVILLRCGARKARLSNPVIIGMQVLFL